MAFNSAFDFAYLLKLVTQAPLPLTETEFHKSLELFFPCFYDVKHIRNDEGDLNTQLRNECITRLGNAHQAGSDSLVTLQLYHKSVNQPHFKSQNMALHMRNTIYKLTGEQRKNLSCERERRGEFGFKSYFRKVESTSRGVGRRGELTAGELHNQMCNNLQSLLTGQQA